MRVNVQVGRMPTYLESGLVSLIEKKHASQLPEVAPILVQSVFLEQLKSARLCVLGKCSASLALLHTTGLSPYL